MSSWSDKFNEHPFIGVWEQLISLSQEEELAEDLDESSLLDLARLVKVITYANGIIKSIDPDIFPFNLLPGLQKQSQACFNELNAYKGNKNIAHIQNANNHADVILQTLHQSPASLYSIGSENIKESVSAYADSIGSFINNYTARTEEYTAELESRIKALSEELQDRENKLDKLDSELATVTQTIQQQTSEFNTQYQSSETSRNEKFDKAYDKYTSDFDKAYEKFRSESDGNFKSLAERASKIIEVLVKFQDDAAKVYGVTINTLHGGAYSSYANEEKNSANWLRRLAALLMLIGVGFLVVPEVVLAFKDEPYVFLWEKVLGRLPLSLVVFVPAFYFAKESSKHRNNEVANRRRQHILTTLDPYIELMDEDKAQELKADVAKTIFSETSVSSDSEAETANLISQLANLAKQIKGK